MYHIGVDIGGTFTDIVLIDEKGKAYIAKAPSTPQDQSIGVMNALTKVVTQLGVSEEDTLKETSYFSHGSTVATNALIQQNGVKTGLIVTKAIRDIYGLRRGGRKYMFDPRQEISKPLVSRHLTFGVTERIDYAGEVVEELNEEEVRNAVRELKDRVQALAVCFLFSFVNPKHEKRVKEIIREECPELYTTISCELLPVFREYERLSTTVINCYVGPLMEKYIALMDRKLKEKGLKVGFVTMASSGGVLPAEEMCEKPVHGLLSGPAAGAVGASYFGQIAGFDNLIAFDMGGTSTDVSLCVAGRLEFTEVRKYDLGKGNVQPAAVPAINVHTIGAGGGSIAYVDIGGALHVGPLSQGANPGPACYDLGGTEACVTDATLVLGYLNPDYFCGGDLKINPELSKKALKEKVAAKLNMDIVDAAQGIYEIVNMSMADAVRVVSVQRGYDPRDFILVVFGAAGPVHAAELLRELGITRAIVPPMACGLSAAGLIASDVQFYLIRTYLIPMNSLDVEKFGRLFNEMEEDSVQRLKAAGVSDEAIRIVRQVDMRYLGQAHEVMVQVPSGDITQESIKIINENFDREHEKLYAHSHPGDPAELANLRVIAIGVRQKPKPERLELGLESPEKALKFERDVFWKEYGAYVKTPIYERARLKPNNRIKGPAIVEEPLTTIVIPPSFNAEVDVNGNVVISMGR